MPSVFIAVSRFPNVPFLPGVPQLLRSLLFPPAPPPIALSPAAQGALWQSTQAQPVWGLVDGTGRPVVVADAVMEFGYRHESRVSDFPVQRGQFSSYNRVNLPFENRLVLTKGGTTAERAAFLSQIDAIDVGAGALALYTILTPEKPYRNVNVTHVELSRRGTKDATFFDVEIAFREIRETTAQYSTSSPVTTPTDNAAPVSAIPFINQGLTQPQIPDAGALNLLNDGLLFNNPAITNALITGHP